MAHNEYDLDFQPKIGAITVIITIYNRAWKEKNKDGYKDPEKRTKRRSQKVRTLITFGTR